MSQEEYIAESITRSIMGLREELATLRRELSDIRVKLAALDGAARQLVYETKVVPPANIQHTSDVTRVPHGISTGSHPYSG